MVKSELLKNFCSSGQGLSETYQLMKTSVGLCVGGFFGCCFLLLMYGHMLSSISEKNYELASTPMLAALILQLFGFCNRAIVCHNDQNTRDCGFQRSVLHLAVSGGQEAHSHGNQSADTDQERGQGKVCLQALSFFFLCTGVIDKVDSAMSKMQTLVFSFF